MLKWSASISAVATRAVVCIVGGTAITWALYTFPIFWRQSGIEQTAKHIAAGETFKPTVLNALKPDLAAIGEGKWERSVVLGGVAVIRLRFLEQSIADGDDRAIDRQMGVLQTAIRKSLANTPADSFLWLVLFWLDNTRNGFARDHLKYLRMSYLTGPDEGWIAVKRNRLALAVFSLLPVDLAKDATDEFARLVDSLLLTEAADILTGPGWPIRNVLLRGLKDVPEVNRQLFAKTIFKLGYDVLVPGVERPAFRPWQ